MILVSLRPGQTSLNGSGRAPPLQFGPRGSTGTTHSCCVIVAPAGMLCTCCTIDNVNAPSPMMSHGLLGSKHSLARMVPVLYTCCSTAMLVGCTSVKVTDCDGAVNPPAGTVPQNSANMPLSDAVV